MTPETFARNLAASDDPADRALGVAIMYRGLVDDDGTRQGWPPGENVARAAARYLGIADPSRDFLAQVIATAPTVSDAMLNRSAR